MGSGLECPKCGTVAVNMDFCPCGEYLQWEITTTPEEPLASRARGVPAAGGCGSP